MLRDHGALVAVHGDAGVVERLFGVFEDVIEICHSSLKHSAEVARDQGPADCWQTHTVYTSAPDRNIYCFIH